MIEAVIDIVATYLSVGVLVTIVTKDREQDGWLWMILFWPMQLASQFR